MYNTRILTAEDFGTFEKLYEDFRIKAATEYNFELEPLDYDGFLDAIDKDIIPFSAYIPGKFASGLNPMLGHCSCSL